MLTNTIQGSVSNEYLLVAYPDKTVREKVLQEINDFNNAYGLKPSHSNPYIIISNFFAREGMEDTLIRWLQRICSQAQGFELSLNNYSGFPAHSIYLRVQDSSPVKQFVKQLVVMNDFVQPATSGISKRPHIMIGSKLNTETYERALIDYSHKHFHETFHVKELVLLKRKDVFEMLRTVQIFGLLPTGNDLFNKVA
jgi:hypothetical protein